MDRVVERKQIRKSAKEIDLVLIRYSISTDGATEISSIIPSMQKFCLYIISLTSDLQK